MELKLTRNFLNILMKKGKKDIAIKTIKNTLYYIENINYISKAINNCKPSIILKAHKEKTLIPTPINNSKQEKLAIKWFIEESSQNKRNLYINLADQLKLAAEHKGKVYNKKLSLLHKIETYRNNIPF